MTSQRGTLVVACLATAVLMLDIAVVNTALPYIADDLGAWEMDEESVRDMTGGGV